MKHLSWIVLVFSAVGCSSPPNPTGTGGTGGLPPDMDGGVAKLCSSDAQCPSGERCQLPTAFQCPPNAFCNPLGICVPATDAAAPSDGGQCVAHEGEHCGGFIQNPCICAPGLQCVLSSIPDVGGTCKPLTCVQNALCIQGSSWDPKLCRCVPNADAGAPECTTASDCQGVLPQLCMQCPATDATQPVTACAHWECIGGKCVTKICG